MRCQKFYKVINGKELMEIRVIPDKDEDKNRETIQRLKNLRISDNGIEMVRYTSAPARAERESQRDTSISPPLPGPPSAMGAMSVTPTEIGRWNSQGQQ